MMKTNRTQATGAFLGVWMALLLAGCVTGPEAVPIQKPRSVMLAPTAVDTRLAARLEPGAPMVHRMIGEVLFEQDVQVGTVDLSELDSFWQAASHAIEQSSVSAAPGSRNTSFDVAVQFLVASLRAKGNSFDALVLPYVTVRPGSINGTAVVWDGVSRRLPFQSSKHGQVFMERRVRRTPCTSLYVSAFDAQGRRLFERVGGLEVASRLQQLDNGQGRWAERKDLFQDPDALRPGVQLALKPFLRN
jgi:hypothetical protein